MRNHKAINDELHASVQETLRELYNKYPSQPAENRCVCCGAPIEDGRQVCKNCTCETDEKVYPILKKLLEDGYTRVIRCKECKYAHKSACGYYCEKHCEGHDANYYCAEAERDD